ncbi:hypothetical protein E2562_005816 [Oryza meyeriana var. granulata]|uniref:Pentacotripeptide-repeat region of PRORP domain-containing protein n=1 Tax=Oryza meyeriana var. granulata TaxID=110450 RepID=A0A6G1CC51_9ORYZ|nr:hypothetical protein E2562_005816 [Oryza meyeriana var. granulata]
MSSSRARVRVRALGPDGGTSRLNRTTQGRQRAAKSSEDAHHAFDELLHRGSRSIYDLNRALSDVARGSPAAAVSLFNRMARDKVAPDLCTYGIVIACCSRVGQLDLAFATVGRVIRTGWRVNPIFFNPLLKGLCVHDRTSEAMDIALRRMPDLGCTPNVFSYSILLKGLCDSNRNQQALDLLHIMADDSRGGCPPDVVSYNTVINGLLREGQVDKAYCLFDEMLDQGISPDVVTYSSIIATLSKSQAMDKATEALTRMVKNGFMPDCITYTSFVHGYCSSGKPKEAIAILKKMRRGGVEPNVVTYTTLMDYLCKSGRSMEAREVFDSMVKRGHKPTIATYATLLHGIEDAFALFRQMASKDVSLDIITYSTLLQGLFLAGRTAAVKELYLWMIGSGMKLDLENCGQFAPRDELPATYLAIKGWQHLSLCNFLLCTAADQRWSSSSKRACPSVQVGLSLPGPRLNSVEDRHPADPSLRRGQGESGLNLAMVGHVTAAKPELGIHPFSPESFLLRFQNSAPGFKLSFRPWTRLSQASVGQLCFRVRIHLYGRNETLPAYLYWL